MEMKFKLSYVGLIGVIFAVIALAAIFFDWVAADVGNISWTGWELFSDADDSYDGYMRYYPVLTLVAAVVALLVYALEFVGLGSNITRIVGIVFGVLVIVFAFLAYNEFTDLLGPASDMVSMGAGLYLTFVGGIGVAVAGILGFLGILPEN